MQKTESRNENFSSRQSSKIWFEQPDSANPYIAVDHFCHGYNLIELMEKRSFVDVFFLLFNGKLPSSAQSELLQQLMIALINPGPRHPATRAGLNAAVGKTDSVHILPISLAVIGGAHLGAAEVEASMRFIKKNLRKPTAELAATLVSQDHSGDVDHHPAPGFGSRFSAIDIFQNKIAKHFVQLDAAGKHLQWGNSLADALAKKDMGWLSTGLAAATLLDLGFNAKQGAGIYQLLSAPGLLAHGQEYCSKPITAMPFVKDEDYFIERPEDEQA
ncbi:citrate synthase [Malonomonas rubra DSM 5091]|uniref:Citrate synthase n=1 Tax=Malonomonas rubra DSM 5091 TaxID=1122189 RepID=A0A1M6BHI2_MALRU|nr:citrate/2-methylcitrate synthase [Malonomonas rubra]SHI48169.1 citrate synthase [Malonomonas rubra DSM 5091]